MKVRMGDRQGIGVLEQSIFGPYRPYNLEATSPCELAQVGVSAVDVIVVPVM